jgi:hypothetical protein
VTPAFRRLGLPAMPGKQKGRAPLEALPVLPPFEWFI